MIELRNVSFIYSDDGPFETKALNDISLKIEDNGFYGLIGHTGSGKTTLVQLIAGLVKPSSGEILIDGVNIAEKKFKMRDMPQRIGLVFQYPEYQLFEETVFDDVAFGPRNMGCDEAEVRRRVTEALQTVGIKEKYYKASPFELSGGQKRRVAIAGTISMEPPVLILDEPAAGLDPHGRESILQKITKLQKDRKITVILVSHSMEDIARTAEKVIVLNKGKLEMLGTTREVFAKGERLSEMGLSIPEISRVVLGLRERGINIREDVLTVDEAAEEILKLAAEKGLIK
ncbi:MAG: energy-coupling factor transporter ATPase [Clostridia bacterium]|nr:energy-coupling factor transporter ATPase [Clostridia bacterium]